MWRKSESENPTVTGILKRLDEKDIFSVYRMQTTEEKDNLSYGKAYDIRRKWKLTGASWTEN